MEKKPLIVLTGPTSVGKSKLSIALAKAVNGEIISADSMQVYRGMDIGSAKITKEEMMGVAHHLIDVLDPVEDFNICTFKQMCDEIIPGIYDRGHIPILVGGTGFYIQAVLRDIEFDENDDSNVFRKEYEAEYEKNGSAKLLEELKNIDPESFDTIDHNNIKRVIRALEFYKLTGKKISLHNEEQKAKESPYNFCYFVLNDVRELIYQRIEKRVDEMVNMGLIEEVKRLKDMGLTQSHVSMQGLGYKEILAYLEGECSLEDALYIIKRDTRHFAKRQITWFKREKDVVWVNKQDFDYSDDLILDFMIDELKNRKIL